MQTVVNSITLLAVIIVTGWSLVSAARKYGICQNRFSLTELLFVVFLSGILPLGAFGLILALLGLFSLYSLLLCMIVTAGAVCIASKSFANPAAVIKKPEKTDLLILAFILIAAFLVGRPFEYIFGGWDPGVYVNTGVNTARTGSLVIHDKLLETLPEQDQELFAHPRNKLIQKYSGFPIANAETGTIIPYFYHLYPVWIAIFSSLGRIDFALNVNIFFGLLCIAAIFCMVKEYFGREPAFIAAFLLAVNVAQLWHMRFPTTEILAQFLFMSGIYALGKFLGNQSRENTYFGILAALCLAEAAFTRISSVFVILPILVFFALSAPNGKNTGARWFLVTLAVLLGLCLLYNLTIAYFPTKVLMNTSLFRTAAPYLAVILLFALLLWLILRKTCPVIFSVWLPSLLKKRWSRIALTAAVCIPVLCGAFPYMQRYGAFFRNSWNLSWFISLPGTILASLGLGFLIWQKREKKHMLLLLMFVFYAFPVLGNLKIHSIFMWAERRFIPIILPFFLIFAAFAVSKLTLSNRKLRYVTTFILLSLLSFHNYTLGRTLLKNTDYSGAVDFCETVSKHFAANDIIICNGSWLATPLQYIAGRTTLQVSDQTHSKQLEKARRILKLMKAWIDRGKKVYYVSQDEKIYSTLVDFEYKATEVLQTKLLERVSGRLPEKINQMNVAARIYKIKPLHKTASLKTDKHTIEVGYDFLSLIDGFYETEPCFLPDPDAVTWRWTGPSATVKLPVEDMGSVKKAIFHIKSNRPDNVADAAVVISAGKNSVKRITIPAEGSAFKEYDLVIAEPCPQKAGIFTITITSSVWRPSEKNPSTDDRQLGVMVDKILLQDNSENTVAFVDIGSGSEEGLTGFYHPESRGTIRVPVRWTRKNAKIAIPWFGSEKEHEITLHATGGRYPEMEKAELQLRVNGTLIWEKALSHTFEQYKIRVPAGTVPDKYPARAVLSFKTGNPWQPVKTGKSRDKRKLGVCIDWIKVRKR